MEEVIEAGDLTDTGTPPQGRTRKRRSTTNRQEPYPLRKQKMTAHSPKGTRATPNPSVPTTPTGAPPFPEGQLDGLLKHMQALIDNAEKRQTSKIQDTIKDLRQDLSGRMDGADSAIKKLQEELRDTKKQVAEIKAKADGDVDDFAAVGRRPRPPLHGANAIPIEKRPDQTARPSPREDMYWTSRRSLKLAPIPRTEETLRVAVANFMLSKLRIKKEEIVVMKLECERLPDPKTRPGSKAMIKDEVLVTYASVATRDYVRTHAKNLKEGASLRLDIPPHLRGDYAQLQDLGFRLKKSNETCKRNIKFNDQNMELVMDFCVDEETWRTVNVAEAKNFLSTKTKKRQNSVTSNDLCNLIDESDEEDKNME